MRGGQRGERSQSSAPIDSYHQSIQRGGRGPVMVGDAHTDSVPAGDHAYCIDCDPFAARAGHVTYLGNDSIRLAVGPTRVARPTRRWLGRFQKARPRQQAPRVHGCLHRYHRRRQRGADRQPPLLRRLGDRFHDRRRARDARHTRSELA